MYWMIAMLLFVGLWLIFGPETQNRKEMYHMVCFGDSMLGPVKNINGIVNILEDKLQRPIYNGALGGTSMSRRDAHRRLANGQDSLSMVALAEAVAYGDYGPQKTAHVKENGTAYFPETIAGLREIDFEGVDIILIEHGTNDYNSGVPLRNEEEPEDEYTFVGALTKAINLLKNKFPDARIIIVTPTYCWFPQMGYDCETWKPAGATLAEYVEAEKQVAMELGVEVIDNYTLFSHDQESDCYKYTVDGLHATELGRKMIADAIVQYLLDNP